MVLGNPNLRMRYYWTANDNWWFIYIRIIHKDPSFDEQLLYFFFVFLRTFQESIKNFLSDCVLSIRQYYVLTVQNTRMQSVKRVETLSYGFSFKNTKKKMTRKPIKSCRSTNYYCHIAIIPYTKSLFLTSKVICFSKQKVVPFDINGWIHFGYFWVGDFSLCHLKRENFLWLSLLRRPP